ncbi:MAG: radical SAM protein [Pseudobdellovibrionaceae bacterium]
MLVEKILAQLDRISIHESALESGLAQRVLKIVPSEKISLVQEQPGAHHRGSLSAEQFSASKRHLYIHPFVGKFFKRCPGATQKKTLTCCNYYVLNLGAQCNFNCSYCYLQSYLNTPVMHAYSNISQAIDELEEMAREHSHLPYRVGTGEVIDSLSLDPLTLFSVPLIEFFRKYPRWTLEFKTKSNHVDQFLSVPHAGNVVVSWSINADEVIRREEHGTASQVERLQAARKCADRGFQVAFHIDPLVWHPQWEVGYSELVDQITQMFKPEEVHVISIGALRFQPEQRHLMRERFGLTSLVTQAEMFPSDGGKMRYDFRLRNQMYQHVVNGFKASGQKWKVFFCMETPESWISSMEGTPLQVDGLKDFFRPLPKIKSESQQDHSSETQNPGQRS